MTAFYYQASLVVVPSGYKSGKIYAQKPLTTDGQLTFTRARTDTRVNASGLIETVASGVPRLDYTDSTCPKLLLEPQRTNLVTWSEAFDNANWSATGLTVTANSAVSPDGTQNAEEVNITVSSGHFLWQGCSVVAGTSYVFSFYVKRGTAVDIKYRVYDETNANDIIPPTSYYNETSSNWTRITLSFTAPTGCSTARVYLLSDSVSTGTVYFWGAMLEAGAYATSYVKTEAAAVTRLADLATKTGISSLIGSTEGVLFVEADITLNSATGRVFMDVNDNDLTNRVVITISNNVVGGFVQGVTRVAYAIPNSGRYKIAFGYKSGDFVLYVNGVQRSTSSASVTFSGMSQLFLGHTFEGVTTQPSDPIAQVLVFKTRLSNAKLAELTTL